MKIYLFTKSFLPTIGGVENSIYYLSKHFQKLNIEVEVVSFDGEFDFEESLIDEIKVTRFKFNKSKLPNLSYSSLKNKAKEVTNNLFSNRDKHLIITRNSALALGLLENNLPIIHIFPTISLLNVNGLYNSNKPHFKILKTIDYLSLKKIEQKIINHSLSTLVTFSELMKNQILSQYKTNKEINVIYPGVDLNRFKYYPEFKKETINKFPFLNSDYILFVGRLAKAKNIDILLDSFKLINTPLNLIIVGDGPEKEFIWNEIKHNNLQERVFLLGTQNEILSELYSCAKATVLPTRIETFGQVIIESLACGTPVVAFGNDKYFFTATKEIILTKENGAIVNEYDSQKLAFAIEKVVNSGKKIAENVSYCKEKFNWDSCCKKLIFLLNE